MMNKKNAYKACFWQIPLGLIITFFILSTPPAMAQEATSSDEIVIKSTDAIMFQITANMKLSPDQISAIRSIVTDNIVKVRNLQLGLQHGDIDAKTIFNERQQANSDEDEQLGHILSADQMKVWLNIQNP